MQKHGLYHVKILLRQQSDVITLQVAALKKFQNFKRITIAVLQCIPE